MQNESTSLIEIGRIVGCHGLRGDLKIFLNSGDPELLQGIDELLAQAVGGQQRKLRIVRQAVHKGRLLLRFGDYESINLAEALIGHVLYIESHQLPELAADEYYWGQLEGLQVIDEKQGDIGCLSAVYTTAAHDTYVVDGRFGTIDIPAVKEFIQQIDLEARQMHVTLPDGLIAEQA